MFENWDEFLSATKETPESIPDFFEINESWISFRNSSTDERTTVFPNAEEQAAFSRAFEIKREDTDR